MASRKSNSGKAEYGYMTNAQRAEKKKTVRIGAFHYRLQDNEFLLIVRTIGVRSLGEAKIVKKIMGESTGLGVGQFMASLLRTNEMLPLSKKMTDEEIGRQFIKEFPGGRGTASIKSGKDSVQSYRRYYNSGRLTGTRPSVVSRRYGPFGVLLSRTGREAKKQSLRRIKDQMAEELRSLSDVEKIAYSLDARRVEIMRGQGWSSGEVHSGSQCPQGFIRVD